MGEKTTRRVGVYIGSDTGADGQVSAMKRNIEILSDPAELMRVRQETEAFALDAGLDETCAGRVVLAVDEALTNIIRHAYAGRHDGRIEIAMRASDQEMSIVIRDYGHVVHPAAIRSRDLDDVRPGGLGVHIMRECMDEVSYAPAGDGPGTVLTMSKKI